MIETFFVLSQFLEFVVSVLYRVTKSKIDLSQNLNKQCLLQPSTNIEVRQLAITPCIIL